MSLPIKLGDLITAIGTDYKGLKSFLTGSSTGALTGLNTTAQNVIGAINELEASGATVSDASETVKGIAEVATTGETTTGTDDTRIVTPLKLAQRLASFNVSQATETALGTAEIATQAETTTGTDDLRFVTPLKLAQKLTAWAQPLNANLTTLAGVASGAFGRTLLGSADAAAAKTSLGLATVATSGSAADLTGVLGTAQLPPLAINETFTAANQAAMLALTAQRGDVAIRTDTSRSYILATDSPGTLADWKLLTAAGDVISVAGRTGAVVLTKTDVGLANADNTSDANKPVSTAQATSIGLRLEKSQNLADLANAATARTNLGVPATAAVLAVANNLSDVASVATARTNLSVYSKAEMGDPETDLVALYTAAKA